MHPSHIFLQNINRNCTPQKVDDIYQETFLGYFCISSIQFFSQKFGLVFGSP